MIETLFWSCLAVVLGSHLLYPAVLYLITRGGAPETPMVRREHLPDVAAVIVAYNEEQVIRAKIENTFRQDFPPSRLHVYLVSDGSTDATVQTARDAASGLEGCRLRIFQRRRRCGKTACLNWLVKKLQEDFLVFTDANSLLEPDAVSRLIERLASPGIGCVVGELRFSNAADVAVRAGEGLYWRYENLLKSMESTLGSTLVANGALYAARRCHVVDIPDEMEHDLGVPLRALEGQSRVLFAPQAVAHEKAATSLWEEFRRKVRIVNLQMAAVLHENVRLLRIDPRILLQLVLHKILRWVAAPALPAAWLAAFALRERPLYGALWVAGSLFAAAGAAGILLHGSRWNPRALRFSGYILMVNLAAALGLAAALLGIRYRYWEKAASTR